MADLTQQQTPQQNRSPFDIDFGSLVATLPPEYQAMLASLGQARQGQDMDQMSQQVQAAQQQAQQTGQQYQQAAQQPVQSQGGANFVNQLLGNTASVLGQQPEYGRRSFEQGQDQEKELGQRRAQNLKAMADIYEQQVQQAERLDNQEAAEKFRSKLEAAHSKQQMVLAGLKAKSDQEALAGRGQQAKDLQTQRDTAAMQRLNRQIGAGRYADKQARTAEQDAEDDRAFGSLRYQTDAGDFVDGGKVVGVKDKARLLRWAAANNVSLLDSKQAGALTAAEIAYRNLTDQATMVRNKLAEGPQDRPMIAARNWAAKMTGTDPVIGAFDSMWSNAIQALKAYSLQGGGPSLMRINKAEIDKALLYDRPNLLWDTKPILDQKMKNFEIMRRNGGSAILQKDWRTLPAIGSKKWKVMRPDGVMLTVPGNEGDRLVREDGYARVLDDDPRLSGSEPATPGPQGPAGHPSASMPRGGGRTFGSVMRSSRVAEGEDIYNQEALPPEGEETWDFDANGNPVRIQ